MPRKGYKRFTAGERLSYVQQWKESGMTQTDFAKKVSINDKTLSAWIRHFASKNPPKQSNEGSEAPFLLPIKITQAPSSKLPPRKQALSINILLPSGIKLCVNAGDDIAKVIDLIKAYELCN